MGILPYEVYIRNDKGQDFVQVENIGIRWQDDAGIVFVQTISVTPGHWKKAGPTGQSAGVTLATPRGTNPE
ncbi:MAG: hypothetical protein WB987_08390 [Candidatus Acidiferrales bacterium]